MSRVEGTIEARLMHSGHNLKLSTNNAVFALFTHDVNRNLDPQLHTHSFLLNMTHTPSGWRSLYLNKLFDGQRRHELGKEYRSALAYYLKQAGYTLTQHRDPTLFEIQGVPEGMIRAFSSRSKEIENWFRDHGVNYDPNLAKTIALVTRKRKKHLSDDEKQRVWSQVATQFDFDLAALNQQQPTILCPLDQSSLERKKAARKALSHALNHLAERDMAFTIEGLEKTALEFTLGDALSSDIVEEVQRLQEASAIVRAPDHSDPGKKDEYWTTPILKVLEAEIIDLMAQEQDKHNPFVSEETIAKRFRKTTLNEQQKAAIGSILLTKDRFFGLQGDPGVGKTTALREYKNILDKAGYEVIGMAPSYQAVSELSESLGIKGMTVDRYISDPRSAKLGRAFRKQVWVVDEASMLAADRVVALMHLAKERDARVLFSGDHQQLEAVGSGRAFLQLQRAGISTAVLNKWMRPKNDYMNNIFRQAMGKKYKRLLTTLRTEGKLRLEKKEDIQIENLSEDWLSLSKEERDQTIIVAPTNEQCKALNQYIRDKLILEGTLKGADRHLRTFDDANFTHEQTCFAGAYKKNQVVRFSYEYKKIADGGKIAAQEYFTVVGVNKTTNRLALRSMHNDRTLYVDPSKTGGDRKGGIQVYERSSIDIARGDRIRWLNNKNEHGLHRNTALTVLEVNDRFMRVKAEDGKKLNLTFKDFRNQHFCHDYAKTAYGVQGATYKRAFALMSSWRINTTHQRSMMVALTRASHDASLYTDNEGALLKALERTGDNTEALTKPEFEQKIEYSKGRYSRALI